MCVAACVEFAGCPHAGVGSSGCSGSLHHHKHVNYVDPPVRALDHGMIQCWS